MIKAHIPTEEYGYLEVEFKDLEDLKEKYEKIYVGVKLLHKKAVQECFKKEINNQSNNQ